MGKRNDRNHHQQKDLIHEIEGKLTPLVQDIKLPFGAIKTCKTYRPASCPPPVQVFRRAHESEN